MDKAKPAVFARVIVSYPDHLGPTDGTVPLKTIYAAGFIEGYSGSTMLIRLPMGTHEFSREDGTWRCGDCLNYKDARIIEAEAVEASIRDGHGGDVEAWRRSLPVLSAAS